jgi:DNA-binding winged helix-turn-helix (wHTH) protein
LTFYKFDDDGNELNRNGYKEIYLKAMRFKPLEYLCEELNADDLDK